MRHVSPTQRAPLWMLGCVVSLTIMALAVRELSSDLSVAQILFFRTALGLPIVAAIALATGTRLRTDTFGLHVLRNLIHVSAQLAWIFAVATIPLATVFAVEFSAPVWGVLLGALILRQIPTLRQVGGVLVGLCGVVAILQPWTAPLSAGLAAILYAAFGFAGTWLTTGLLGRRNTSLTIVFWMCLLQSPIGLALSLTDWRPVSAGSVAPLAVLAGASLTAHFCLAQALKRAPLVQVVTIDYIRLPLAAAAGAALYAEPIEAWTVVGGLIVLAGVLLSQSNRWAGKAT